MIIVRAWQVHSFLFGNFSAGSLVIQASRCNQRMPIAWLWRVWLRSASSRLTRWPCCCWWSTWPTHTCRYYWTAVYVHITTVIDDWLLWTFSVASAKWRQSVLSCCTTQTGSHLSILGVHPSTKTWFKHLVSWIRLIIVLRLVDYIVLKLSALGVKAALSLEWNLLLLLMLLLFKLDLIGYLGWTRGDTNLVRRSFVIIVWGMGNSA
jgi:hypothetical protein